MATANLVTAKTLDEVKLSGVRISWEKQDGSVRSVTLTDGDGNMARITRANSYSEAISVLIPEPPKFEDRWVLHGEFAHVAINRAFPTEREAQAARDEFPNHASLEITKKSLAVSDGKLVEEPSDIPF